MKTVKKNDEILRVNNEIAEKLVNTNGYFYTPKKEWKLKIRDISKQAAEKRADEIAERKAEKKNEKSNSKKS